MRNCEIISTLNALIETCLDAEEEYIAWERDVSDRRSDLKKMLAGRQFECAAAATELQELVFEQRGDPQTSSSVGGALHRSWFNIKTVITGRDDRAILIECTRSGESAARRYRNALEADLPTDIRFVVERQYQTLLRSDCQTRKLLEQMKIAA